MPAPIPCAHGLPSINRCEECTKLAVYEAGRRWRLAHPERARAAAAAWRARNLEHVREYGREHHRTRRAPGAPLYESRRAMWRRYCEEHREERAASMRDYRRRVPSYSKSPAHAQAYQRRRARLASADVRTVTTRDLRRLELRQGGRCCYCAELRPLTLEHVIPLARGGRHAIGNLAYACRTCNSSKGTKLRVEHLARLRNRERIAA